MSVNMQWVPLCFITVCQLIAGLWWSRALLSSFLSPFQGHLSDLRLFFLLQTTYNRQLFFYVLFVYYKHTEWAKKKEKNAARRENLIFSTLCHRLLLLFHTCELCMPTFGGHQTKAIEIPYSVPLRHLI